MVIVFTYQNMISLLEGFRQKNFGDIVQLGFIFDPTFRN